ncbi:uncharacterized protein LOC132549131 [Ylistrum balloti]|uniref:uncharacterized protein LOC132549131 n=1 Tax=Ylistrum balloti TaxID=509963 RepID=UPI0029058AE4|nr:uncharacterized protein LOC132549131 [Ylistrum balloti]
MALLDIHDHYDRIRTSLLFQNHAAMDCPTWIKQEPHSPLKKTFRDASSPFSTAPDIPVGDDHLSPAPSEPMTSGLLLPLIKDELRYTILNRRFAKGQADIVLKDPPKPKLKQELTAAELERKSRRREQNRRAATKCRIKKKGVEDSLITTFYKEQEKNTSLNDQINNLRSEKAMLEKVLEEHLSSRECTIPPLRDTSYTPPLSAQPPAVCCDSNAGSATSPSLYGGDMFTFDIESNKTNTMTSVPCPSFINQTPGQCSGYPQSSDMFVRSQGPIHEPITPPAENTSYGREFDWAEDYLNITELLSGDLPPEIPVLNSDDLNNLPPPDP